MRVSYVFYCRQDSKSLVRYIDTNDNNYENPVDVSEEYMEAVVDA